MIRIIVFIVALAFIGIYINKHTNSNLTDPELYKLPQNKIELKLDKAEISGDTISTMISDELEDNSDIYNTVGEMIKGGKEFKNNGLVGGFTTLDINAEKLSSVGSKRPESWYGASTEREWPDNKTVNAGLSYNVYHSMDTNSLINIKSSDIKNNVSKMTGPDVIKSAGEQNIGFFLGKDKTYDILENTRSNKDITHAISIIRNAVSNENKQLINMSDVDRSKVNERYSGKQNNSISSYTEIKVKPNINVSLTEKDVSNIVAKRDNIDPLQDLIKNTQIKLGE